NYVLLTWLTATGVGLVVAKVLVEIGLFVAAYQVQRSFVFGSGAAQTRVERPAPRASALVR
ncbi:hypothetical protein ACSNOK_33865, partial [Streptomyces sp. URMC 126]|uniref:hypothetical protein n=1 Tax=Streptomyces sp. URMC 126 TaxID=3423401 RepID=UPI003F1A3894